MASVERLTKRVSKMEEWIKENEDTGGPQGTLETFKVLINERLLAIEKGVEAQNHFNQIRGLLSNFLREKELLEDWNKYCEEQDALQNKQAEEVPLQEETDGGEETIEAPVKEEEKE
jgi:hypothetical protein